MKQILRFKHIYILLLLTFISMGCKKDKEGSGDTSGAIEGTWELTSLSFVTRMGPAQTNSVGKNINNVLLMIHNDGTTSGNGKTFQVETSVAGISGTTSTESELVVNTGEWERNGDTFTWTGHGETRDFTILEVTGSTLHLAADYGDDIAFHLFNSIDLKFKRKN